jgi:hypothetical protein
MQHHMPLIRFALSQTLRNHRMSDVFSAARCTPHRNVGECRTKLTSRCYVHDPYKASVLSGPISPAAAYERDAKISNISFSSAASTNASDGGVSHVTSPEDASITSAELLRTPATLTKLTTTSPPLDAVPRRVVLPHPRSSAAMLTSPIVLRVRINKYQTVLATASPLLLSQGLREGCPVVIDGDRGEDMGYIEDVVHWHDESNKLVSVLRLPTDAEVARFRQQREDDEPRALRALRSMAKDVHFEGIVEDAIYQWDGKKLTLFISRANPRQFLNFRTLQRASYQQFQCRIWMVYVDEL